MSKGKRKRTHAVVGWRDKDADIEVDEGEQWKERVKV